MTVLFITGCAIFLVGIFLCLVWAGKCKKCGSRSNWRHERDSTDNYRPDLIYTRHLSRCRNCGEEVDLGQSSRSRLS